MAPHLPEPATVCPPLARRSAAAGDFTLLCLILVPTTADK